MQLIWNLRKLRMLQMLRVGKQGFGATLDRHTDASRLSPYATRDVNLPIFE
jgi:hypothetical protein